MTITVYATPGRASALQQALGPVATFVLAEEPHAAAVAAAAVGPVSACSVVVDTTPTAWAIDRLLDGGAVPVAYLSDLDSDDDVVTAVAEPWTRAVRIGPATATALAAGAAAAGDGPEAELLVMLLASGRAAVVEAIASRSALLDAVVDAAVARALTRLSLTADNGDTLVLARRLWALER